MGTKRRFDRRTFALITGAALAGGLWAGYNLWTVGAVRDLRVARALIWTVFATPFAMFFGWAWARPAERWRALWVSFLVYFFAILIAARLERLILGETLAASAKHALYFRLTLAFDLLACLAIALQRAFAIDTALAEADATPPG